MSRPRPLPGSSASLRGRLRRWAGLAHLWLGLGAGAVFALAGLTGALLVFYPELDAASDARLRSVDATARPVSYEAVYQALRAHAPNRPGPWRIEVPTGGGPLPARYYQPAETAGRSFAPLMVWVDPGGPGVVREAVWGEYAATWIYDLHYALLLGDLGKRVMAVVGVLILVLLVGGAWLWWPPTGKLRSALTLKRAASPQRRIYDLHKVAGIYGILQLAILSVTGAMLDAPDWVKPVLAQAGPLYQAPHLGSDPTAGRPRLPVDVAVATAKSRFPRADLAWIETPAQSRGVYRVNLHQPGEPSRRFPRTSVWVDPYTGAVLAVRDPFLEGPGDVTLNWLHAVHNGEAAGLPGRIAALLSGLGAVALFVTGVVRWRHKARARRLAPRRVRRAEVAPGQRSLPPHRR